MAIKACSAWSVVTVKSSTPSVIVCALPFKLTALTTVPRSTIPLVSGDFVLPFSFTPVTVPL